MTGRDIAKLICRSEAVVREAWHSVDKQMAVEEDFTNQMDKLFRPARLASE